MPFRCKQAFPREEKCLLDRLHSVLHKDLNIRLETLKLEKERPGNTLEAMGIGNDFLSRTQVAQQLRERIDTWDYMKLESFCTI
jgi:hypothetical protein